MPKQLSRHTYCAVLSVAPQLFSLETLLLASHLLRVPTTNQIRLTIDHERYEQRCMLLLPCTAG